MTGTPALFVHNLRCGGNVINESADDYLAKVHDPLDDGYPVFKLGRVMEREYTWDDFLAEAPLGRKRYFAGHFPFGAARHIPGPVHCLTNVREPESRLASLSKAWSNAVDDPGGWLKNHWDADNGMTRRLAGYGPRGGKAHDFVDGRDVCDEAEFRVTPDVFERAKANLREGVAAVVVKEQFVESLVLAEATLGWPPMFSFAKAHFNQTPGTALAVDPGLMAEIVAANAYDRQLYDLAVTALEAACREADEDTRNTMIARKAIDQMLHVPFRDVLSEAEVTDRINQGLNQLFSQGHRDVALRVMTLFVGHPFPEDAFRESLLESVRRIGSKEEIEAVEHRYHNPFAF